MNGWKSCLDKQPDDERQVIVARPDKMTTEAGQFLRPENVWTEAGTDVQIWPSVWKEMPKHPFME